MTDNVNGCPVWNGLKADPDKQKAFLHDTLERMWKFTKKQCLYNRYYETFHQFKIAINDCLDKAQSTFSEQAKTLLNPKSQLLEKSANVTA